MKRKRDRDDRLSSIRFAIRKDDLCVVLKVHTLKLNIGDWSNGMTEVSKTFSGSSILSSPVIKP